MSRNTTTATLIYVTKSERSILFRDPDSSVEFWLPISEIEYDEDDLTPGHRLDVILPDWLAKREGLA